MVSYTWLLDDQCVLDLESSQGNLTPKYMMPKKVPDFKRRKPIRTELRCIRWCTYVLWAGKIGQMFYIDCTADGIHWKVQLFKTGEESVWLSFIFYKLILTQPAILARTNIQKNQKDSKKYSFYKDIKKFKDRNRLLT